MMSETRRITKAGVTFEVAAREEYRAFWDSYQADTWEPDTVAVFARFLQPDTRYVDLGAWIGSTALLAAPCVLRVVCVEPDPLASAALAENLGLNPHASEKTVVVRAAIGPEDGTVVLSSAGRGGDSNSSVVRPRDEGMRWETEQVSFATLLSRADLAAADFVKIDIEGAEYQLIPELLSQAANALPTLYIALHPNLLVDKRSFITRLSSSVRALRANHRFLRALLVYRHHYVYDIERRQFRDIRRRNVLRVLFPIPVRASFLIGACAFTNEPL
jgi:FkbM family methyltransferase